MLISDAYRAANEHLHATTEFGVTAPQFREAIQGLARKYDVRTILDYGSGPRKHVAAMFLRGDAEVRSYDPCVPALADPPEPADMLVCCDVLEHIEPDCLHEVLDHMRGLLRRVGFFTVATRPAKKTLPDGRNAHLIVEGPDFWLPRVLCRWRLKHFQDLSGEFVAVVEAMP